MITMKSIQSRELRSDEERIELSTYPLTGIALPLSYKPLLLICMIILILVTKNDFMLISSIISIIVDIRTGFEPVTPDPDSGMLAVTPPDTEL